MENSPAMSDSFPLVLKEMLLKMPLSADMLCWFRDLSANQLTGQPPNLGGMNFLRRVRFSGTQLSGTSSNATSYGIINLTAGHHVRIQLPLLTRVWVIDGKDPFTTKFVLLCKSSKTYWAAIPSHTAFPRWN